MGQGLFLMEAIIPLVALTAMEIVLGIDNIVFIAILTAKLPRTEQPGARRWGLALALGTRLLLLFAITWIMGLKEHFFHLSSLGIPRSLIEQIGEFEEIDGISWKDVILFVGGLFLIAKSVLEIHKKIEGAHESHDVPQKVSLISVIVTIGCMDVIFSLDSVITAVGMVPPEQLWVMVSSVVIAMVVMLVFSGIVSDFVEKHPTLKILALSFLILIGVMLVAEGVGTPFTKGYIYFAMFFALIVEFLNLKVRHVAPSKPHP
jgi:predicted tellurium resistance membrane protein TerC